jgi:hypothetical protein
MRKLGIGHVYDIMESVADAGERLETVIRVESAAGGLSPESAELLRSAYDSMLSAVGDLAKAATRQEVYCPRCHSQNCSHYKEQRVIPGKTKTKYTANLNPLKPFTLVNKKEKVIRQDQVVTDNKFMCNECGKIFY